LLWPVTQVVTRRAVPRLIDTCPTVCLSGSALEDRSDLAAGRPPARISAGGEERGDHQRPDDERVDEDADADGE
jgi:hypothetical protein